MSQTHRTMQANIMACGRCGKNHRNVLIAPLVDPPKGYTHWFVCPDTRLLSGVVLYDFSDVTPEDLIGEAC